MTFYHLRFSKKHRASGFDSQWLNNFTWLRHSKEGMTCYLCQKHCAPTMQLATGFVRQPSTNYRLDTLKRHEITAIHKAAEEKEKSIKEGNTFTKAFNYKNAYIKVDFKNIFCL